MLITPPIAQQVDAMRFGEPTLLDGWRARRQGANHSHDQMTRLLRQGQDLMCMPRADLELGLDTVEVALKARPDSPDRQQALRQVAADRGRLFGDELCDTLADQLDQGSERFEALKSRCGKGLVTVVAGLGGALITSPLGLPFLAPALAAVALGGLACCCYQALRAHSMPEYAACKRFLGYGRVAQIQRPIQVAGERAEAAVRSLMQGLGQRGHGVRETRAGVQVGPVLLKRKQPAARG